MLDSVQTRIDAALEDDAAKGVFRVGRDIFTDTEPTPSSSSSR